MSAYAFFPPSGMVPTHGQQNHNNHAGRRRGPAKLSVAGGPKQIRNNVRGAVREMAESAALNNYRDHFEQWISFDLDDDLEFCPGLITEADYMSTSGSERSSLASNSPNASPLQQPQTVATDFSLTSSVSSLSSSSASFFPPAFQSQHSLPLPLHQPAATRAIPIINPATGFTMASPSPSASPHRMNRRW